uniref:Seizure related 6 homolog b n=1 Tax=Denticeps clupeoides TaxID=299321 RepID=A0AAY4DTJ3_9TELE
SSSPVPAVGFKLIRTLQFLPSTVPLRTLSGLDIISCFSFTAPCHANLTAPEGLIESPPQAGSWSTVDCSYSVTAYMGYGVEIQVMNVSLAQGDTVTFEDLGGREPSVLANESILMKGLVVRSWSNQIGIRFHSSRPKPGHFQLRYQAYILSCPFPGRPMYGDVSVTSLHAGGEAFFYCFTGYQLQGPSTLTCYNATMPYWSGREPQCLAACGGVVRNATVGRIVSPGFPGNYSNNLTCHWVLESPEGRRLHIHFEKVALAEDDDRLLIKNGNHIDSPPLYDSYEVEYLPNEGLTSSSRFLFIELTTDGSGTSTGAALRYEAFGPGHCYEPFVKYGNFTSSDSSYAVGAVVEFTCDPGYTLEQGSVIIECMDPNNPQWNETEPACRAVCSGEITDSAGVVLSPNWPEAYDKGQDCIWGIHVEEDKRIMLDIQVLHMGTNDLLTFYDGDDLTAKILGQYGGSRPRFKLYTTTADVTLQFQSDPATNIYGYNNGFVVNFFEVPRNDTCPELPEITNGWKTTSHPELVHGTVVTYQCYPGFEVVGTETLMCQWDLTWSGDLPSCEKMLSCSDPGLVEHSRRVMSGPRLTVGSTVQYICSKGYLLSGNSLLTCYHRDSSGPKWTEKLPKCVPETFDPCQNPGTPSFSTQSPQKRLYQAGETLRFSCQRGYELMGEPLMRCIPGHPSRWSNSPPVCKGTNLNTHLAYFIRIQGKSLQFAVSTSSRYEHIGAEAAYDNPAYENTVSTANVLLKQEFFTFCA